MESASSPVPLVISSHTPGVMGHIYTSPVGSEDTFPLGAPTTILEGGGEERRGREER